MGEEGVDLAEDALLVVVAEVDFEEDKLPTLGVGRGGAVDGVRPVALRVGLVNREEVFRRVISSARSSSSSRRTRLEHRSGFW
jgi:hypothetical protein